MAKSSEQNSRKVRSKLARKFGIAYFCKRIKNWTMDNKHYRPRICDTLLQKKLRTSGAVLIVPVGCLRD